jgi:hypothetical protein
VLSYLKKFQGLKSYGADTKVLWMDKQTDEVHSYNPITATRKAINNVGLVPSLKAIHIKAQDLFIYFWEYLKTLHIVSSIFNFCDEDKQ